MALLGATTLTFTPTYMQNDDVVMAMIASGRGVALQPDAHLVYVNLALGELLRRAYVAAPALPWYGLLLLAVLAAAQVALLAGRLARERWQDRDAAVGLWLPYVAYFVAVVSVFVVHLHFTAVGSLAAGVGLALWIARLAPRSSGPANGSRRPSAGGWLLIALLLLLGGLLRFDALLLALVVALPLAIERLIRSDRRMALRAVGGLAAVLSLPFALQLWDRAAYDRDPGWREFRELNAWRARIVDYGAGGDGPEGRALEQGVGWSANDAVMLRRWFYADRRVFPIEAMRRLVGAAPLAKPDAAETWSRIREAFHHPSFVPFLLSLPLLVARGRGRERLRILGLTLVPALAVVVGLAVLLRAPEHVSLPALAFPATALLVVGSGDDVPPRRGRLWGSALVLAFLAVTVAVRLDRQDAQSAVEENRDLRASVALLQSGTRQLYVDWAGTFRYEAILPLEDASYLSGLRLYSLGWPQRSPVADRMLQAAGIDDLFRSFFERPDVGLLMVPSWRDSLETYAREHYGVDVRVRESARTPAFSVFRVERSKS